MRNIEKVSIKEVRLSPTNPRIIKDDKFHKLVRSIQEFPEMLEIRPIVVDEEGFVLGGNMRFKACKEAGLKEVYIIRANDLTEEQRKEFVIKDNASFGDWDWEVLQSEWDLDLVGDWGVDVFEIPTELDYSLLDDEDDDDDEASSKLQEKTDNIKRALCIPFDKSCYDESAKILKELIKDESINIGTHLLETLKKLKNK
jgi:ParB-like chromosome segregation protein Spo0J